MRRLAAAILAIPVIASIYLATLLAVPAARRYLAAVGAIALVGIVGLGYILPPPASSVPPSTQRPVAAALLRPVATASPEPAASDGSPSAPPVSAIKAVEPRSVAGERLTPSAIGIVDTQSPGAAGPAGASTAAVRTATTVKVSSSLPAGNRVKLTTAIQLRFDRPVTLAAVRAAFAISPAVKGKITAVSAKVYSFAPAIPLAANTAYTIAFKKPIKDTDGLTVTTPKPVRVLTATAPALVRFRPVKGTGDVDPTSLISVRFTKPMNHSTTAKAFSVVVAGKKLAGTITWAENDTVIVFKPAKALAAGAGVGVRVLGTATSADGVTIKQGSSATFTVVAPPRPATTLVSTAVKPAVKPASGSSTTASIPKTGGSAVGGGTWAAAEAYYLKLMNCTRTGGWVNESGGCDSPGGRDVAPLRIDAGISANVSRPYAKYLATTGTCSHFADGNPASRLRRAGYDSYTWAENISCPKSMDVMALMLYTQRFFQSEKSYNGGHYVNLMNPAYDRVGIGVWVANGRAQVVIDFYHP